MLTWWWVISHDFYDELFYTDVISNENKFSIATLQYYNTFTGPCEISKVVSFASSIMKNIVVFPDWSRFSIKLICCIAFAFASSACCLLQQAYNFLWNM